ncbi:MAG: thymidine phosphorylase [Chloroflexi bacterium]|nr:thymidine phosphorylase [Chloroflexota bacterium]
MRAVDVIIKKRDRGEHTREELEFFILGYTRGDIPDYQVAAWAMAVLLNGMTPRETADLTMVMAHSGQVLDLSDVVPRAVDKHSTGGVGDKTSLVVVPAVAAAGLPVGKMSGRGLGFSGGTLDKLESIPGYRTDLTVEEFKRQLREVGAVLTGQSVDLAPADGKLYALRDVTGTVPSIPLIASSIMSKKIAAGAQAIVFDVKVGLGAFMRTLDQARELATLMVDIARQTGRKAIALLADMNQPLGHAVGNALEVKEAIATLQGQGPADFYEHCLTVAAHMLVLGGVADSIEAGRARIAEVIASGRAWDRFRAMVRAQGGDVRAVDEPERLPRARYIETVPSPRAGYIAGVHARRVGETAVLLGAGREKKGDPVDHAVGIVVHVKVGDEVEAGQPLFTIHANDPTKLAQARAALLDAVTWSVTPTPRLPLFYGVITG